MSWIEFTGEVGAGKTTLAAAFRHWAASCGYRALSAEEAARLAMERTRPGRWLAQILPPKPRRLALLKLYRWWASPLARAAFTRQHRDLVRQVDHSERARRTLPAGHQRIIRRLFFDVAVLYQFALPRLRPGEWVVLDEGFTHRAVNLFAWEPGEVDADAVREYVSHLPATDLVVVVRAPGSVALERAEARGLPVRLRDKDPEVVRRFMAHASEITQIATAQLTYPAPRQRPVVTIENGAAPEDVATGLVKIADGLFRSNGKPPAPPIFTGRALLRLPRPDRWLSRLRFQRQQSSDRDQNLDGLLSKWGLRQSGPARRTGGPGRSGSWLVPTDAGLKILKRYKPSLDREWVIHEHSILQALANSDFPAPRLVPTRDEKTLTEGDDGIFVLFDAYEGYFHYHNSVFLPGMARQFVRAAGQTLAALHLTLRGFVPQGRNPNGFISTSGERWHDLDWYLSRLERCAASAVAVFRQGAASERLCTLDDTLKRAQLERVIAHGDYGPYNLLFRQGSPVVVLDFELARLDWRLTDLSAALFYFARGRTGFHWDKMQWFLDAYRSVAPVSADEMQYLPLVWQFLTLRRIIVLWERSLDGNAAVIREAQERLNLFDWLIRHENNLRSL